MEQSSVNPDLIQVRNVRSANLLYDPTLVSSGMINFATSSNVLSGQRDAILQQELGVAQPNNRPIMAAGDDLFHSLPLTISSQFNASSRAIGDGGDFQGCSSSNWKSLVSQTNSDWMMNYASGSAGREINQNEMLVGEVLSNNVKVSDVPASRKYFKPNSFNEYQNLHSTVTNPASEISCQDREKQQCGDMHYATPLFQNSIQDVVTLASIGTHEGLAVASLVQHDARETGHATWTGSDSSNELVLLPNFGNQSNAFRYTNANTWTNRPVQGCHPWNSECGFIARRSDIELNNVASEATTQGLSLSLSSNPPSKMHIDHFGEGFETQGLHSKTDLFKEPEEIKVAKFDYLNSIPKPSSSSKGVGKSLPELVGTSNSNVQRGTGPLGPFTGYATILKGSRFLKPAQELLDEFCNLTGSKLANTCDVSEKISGDQVSASISVDVDAVDVTDKEVGAKGNSSVIPSSTFYSSNQMSCDDGVGSSSCESYRPEYQQKKARLVSLQEEVCKRYKLYHQQMEMVVSSFESVAGLSAATPYVSLALKSISKNFRCLKMVISNQLKHVTKALGEDLLSSVTFTSTSKGDTNTSMLKYMDQSSQKHKLGGSNMGFLEPQQHVWRPQRGLPERSVAILRAWLFEHFLHPYPTDTDKHMLATQTGLSRNQVSNWFINARVRVWKPMVEEIHMLETKGLAGTSLNPKRSDGQSASDGTGRSNNGDEEMNKVGISAMCDEQLDFSGIGTLVGNEDGLSAEQWNQEKRSRIDCQVTTGMDRSLLSFIPYHRSGMEVGGLGAVSLTLGLRHGVESSHQQEDQLRRQLGGHIIHDFVG
ncbi:hypothetical protein Pint_32124 [Pistacia integerrima]|uniref:Uncharacterized protein n=1 Tax=Pistacia integerrima TaxID=434235 RepID=A0ACC0XS55_9ROSI|nr:hypothetical protein Pint_32124 [Pistacia integerrima]